MPCIRLEVEPLFSDIGLLSLVNQANLFFNIKLKNLSSMPFFIIKGDLYSKKELHSLLKNKIADVFSDPVLSKLHFEKNKQNLLNTPDFVVEVSYKPGVTDNVGQSASEALNLLNIDVKVASGLLYFLKGDFNLQEAEVIANELLGNILIENIKVFSYSGYQAKDFFKETVFPEVILENNLEVKLIDLNIKDKDLESLSEKMCLALTLTELSTIKKYFSQSSVQEDRRKKGLGTLLTDVELEVIAQTWSEHCKHKIFAADICYSEEDIKPYKALGPKNIKSLYSSFIKKSTQKIKVQKEVEEKKNLLISVFTDNAGIVRFDNKLDLCIKVETHNSPSALDPYGGALTGILGVNRDILGCGLGSKPIANTDVFCFAPPKLAKTIGRDFLPYGPKEPRRILEGVHLGVEDGGNKSGIPTVNGAFYFDNSFAGKPLVFVGTIGVLPKNLPDGRKSFLKQPSNTDRIIMLGGAIGADGIHGATFSSLELNENSPVTAVQIGDPLTQKRVLDFLLVVRDKGLYSSITDNGAGGLSSSVGEMAEWTGGARIDLSLCPVKYPGLTPYELMISESQERMTLAVPLEHLEEFFALVKLYGVLATDIGEFNQSGFLSVYYKDKLVANLNLKFLHSGLPKMQLTAKWDGPRKQKEWFKKDLLLPFSFSIKQVEKVVLTLLSSPNIVSKESWVRRYDHEVQGASHIKAFGGKTASGPNDSGVVWLYPHGGEKDNAVAIGCGLNPFLSQYDPYLMAQYATDEAIRNVVATGGDLNHCCLLDNFCWPDPIESKKNPDGSYKLGQLVRACQGLYDACLVYNTPLVSGKDSMKNNFTGKNKKGEKLSISIFPSLLVTAISKVKMGHSCTADFKNIGDSIYVLGNLENGLLGSEFSKLYKIPENLNHIPNINLHKNKKLYLKIHQALQENLLESMHDISDGGLICALAEATFGNQLGANCNFKEDDLFNFLFNEASGRFIISVSSKNLLQFQSCFSEEERKKIGSVTKDYSISISDRGIKWRGESLFKAFSQPL